jgi:sterol-4alpha-carboxylate 3-dehydrogenase (decarboxylating)
VLWYSRSVQSKATCVIHTISPISTRHRDDLGIFHAVNVAGTKNVIDACLESNVRKLIYVGSCGVVFDGHTIANGKETLPYPKKHLDPYTESRALAEEATLKANGSNGLLTVSIRPGGTFGCVTSFGVCRVLSRPAFRVGDRETIVGAYDAWKRNMTHVQLGNNKNLFDKTYVTNVALAVVLAADKLNDMTASKEVAGQAFFITNNEPWPFWDFMRTLWRQFDEAFPDQVQPKKKQFVIPRFLALALAYIMKFMALVAGKKEPTFTPNNVTFATTTMYFSTEKAKKLLGYEPEISLLDGIHKTIEVSNHQP